MPGPGYARSWASDHGAADSRTDDEGTDGGNNAVRVISYNLRKHRASGELETLVREHDPDVICLQEADTGALPARVGDLHLAGSTRANRLGLAVYYREERFIATATQAFALHKSLHDRILTPAHERLVGVRLTDVEAGRDLIVASFHAAPLTALNSLRRKQIRAALEQLHLMGPELPVLMVGDYNYPLFLEAFSERARQAGYDVVVSDSHTYTRYVFFRGHYDLATSMGLTIDKVITLPQGSSDHMPILVTAYYPDETPATAEERETDFTI